MVILMVAIPKTIPCGEAALPPADLDNIAVEGV